jgi:hypothetical protein
VAIDATTQLIRLIHIGTTGGGGGAASAAALGGAALSVNTLSQADDFLSAAADYAQILGTAAGPIAQAFVASTVGEIAQQEKLAEGTATAASESAKLQQQAQAAAAGQAAEDTALVAAEAAGAAAAITLFIAFALAIISASAPGEKYAPQQANADLVEAIEAVWIVGLAQYWSGILTALEALWSPVNTDLNFVQTEGTNGEDVLNGDWNYQNWIGHANSFLGALLPTSSLANYWAHPPEPTGWFPPLTPWLYEYYNNTQGWYGNLPETSTSDPTTMLPVFVLGIHSLLILATLRGVVDPDPSYSFQTFLSQNAGPPAADSTPSNLSQYLSWLWSQYSLAVSTMQDGVPLGIVKTDLPSADDILGFLPLIVGRQSIYPVQLDTNPPSALGGSPPSAPKTIARAGNAWNGIYGVVETFPQYGAYPPPSGWGEPLASQTYYCSPAYFISQLDVTNLVAEMQQTGIIYDSPGSPGSPPSQKIKSAKLNSWVIPWMQNKVILGTMARWKAIYLINGFDRVWSIMQNLQSLAPDPFIVPAKMTVAQDDSIANGNWSARELCTKLKIEGDLLDGTGIVAGVIPADGVLVWTGSPGLQGYSVFALVQVLDNIARGNWGGPPSYSTAGTGPARPLGFRDRLAAAAV